MWFNVQYAIPGELTLMPLDVRIYAVCASSAKIAFNMCYPGMYACSATPENQFLFIKRSKV